MDLPTATPSEVDSALAALYDEQDQLDRALIAAVEDLHYALGERGQYVSRHVKRWPTTTQEALAACKAKVAAPGYEEVPWGHSPTKAIESYEAATELLARVRADMAPLKAEYDRRPWSRFFTVPGGHTHRRYDCQTCHRNGKRTRMGWQPELSGLSDDEALAKLGDWAWLLCTVCFPDAPLERTQGRPDTGCAGSGKAPVTGTHKRVGMNTYAECTGCGERQIVTSAGVTRKHKPPKEK